MDVAADTYAYPAAFNTFSAVIPPWAHDGGDKKLIERLKDPAMRARIRKEMETPSGEWNNEWQQVTGPESFILSAVQNPKLLPLQGKTIAEIAKLWNKDPIDTVFDILIEDEAFTDGGACSSCPSRTWRWRSQQPWVSICNDSQGTAPDGAARQGASASAGLRDVSADSAQVRARGEEADAGGCDPQVHVAPARSGCASPTAACSRQGMWADVVVFDPETMRDVATFDQPNQLSEGMRFVLVNGVPVIEEGKMTNALPGKVVTR